MRADRAEQIRIQSSRPVSGVMFSILFGRSVSRASFSSPNRASSSSRAVRPLSIIGLPASSPADPAPGGGVDVALDVLVEEQPLLAKGLGGARHRARVGRVVGVSLLDRPPRVPSRLALGLRPLEVDLLAR